jgi:opacity protein-like surface antigen
MHMESSEMKTLLLLGAAALASLGMAGTAYAADLPIGPTKAPVVASFFDWTGCYLGGHVGGGWSHKDITDPVQLVQDTLSGAPVTIGVTTVTLEPTGVVVGGQFGCDYQFGPNWVIGAEGAASGSTMKASASVALPLGLPGETELVTARTDFIGSATARLGYAADRLMLYVKGGAAWAGDKYDVTGSFTAIPFGFEGVDQRLGWTVGGGVDWAFSSHWSVTLEYDYYQFGHRSVLMSDPINLVSGPVDIKQGVQIAKLGLNFHMWTGR